MCCMQGPAQRSFEKGTSTSRVEDREVLVSRLADRLYRQEPLATIDHDIVQQLTPEEIRSAYSHALYERLRAGQDYRDLCAVPLSADVSEDLSFRLLLAKSEERHMRQFTQEYFDAKDRSTVPVYRLDHLHAIGYTGDRLVQDFDMHTARTFGLYATARIMHGVSELDDIAQLQFPELYLREIYAEKFYHRVITRSVSENQQFFSDLRSFLGNEKSFAQFIARMCVFDRSHATMRKDLEKFGFEKDFLDSDEFADALISVQSWTRRSSAEDLETDYYTVADQFPLLWKSARVDQLFKQSLEQGIFPKGLLKKLSPGAFESDAFNRAKISLLVAKTKGVSRELEDFLRWRVYDLRLSDTVLQDDPELRSKFFDAFAVCFKRHGSMCRSLIVSFVQPTIFTTPEFAGLLHKEVHYALQYGSSSAHSQVELVSELAGGMGRQILEDPELKQLAIAWAQHHIDMGGPALYVLRAFGLRQEEIDALFIGIVPSKLRDGFGDVVAIAPLLSRAVWSDPGVLSAVQAAVKWYFQSPNLEEPFLPLQDMAIAGADIFTPDVFVSADRWFWKKFMRPGSDQAELLLAVHSVLPPSYFERSQFKELVRDCLVQRMSTGEIVDDLLEYCNDPAVLADSRVAEAAAKGLQRALDKRAAVTLTHALATYPLHARARRNFEQAKEIFGVEVSARQFQIVVAISEKRALTLDLEEYLSGSGLERLKGADLLEQIQRRIQTIRKNLLDETIDLSFTRVPFYSDVVRSMVRAEISEWTRASNFTDLVEAYRAAHQKKESMHALKRGYVQSGVVSIEKRKRSEQPLSEDALQRFAVLQRDLQGAHTLLNNPKPYSYLCAELEKGIEKIKASLNTRLNGGALNEKARQNIEKQIAGLSSVRPRNLQEVEQNFIALARYKELEPILRQLFFLRSLQDAPVFRGQAQDLFAHQKPSADDLLWMTTFVTHVTHRENWPDYFTGEESMKAYRTITSVAALEEGLRRLEQQASSDVLPMRFVPSRGILLHFAGFIGDACFAGQSNIAEEHPNVTAVTMVANPGGASERLVGSAVFIEGTSKSGEPLLIVRALNPLENVITQLNPEKFVQAYLAYAGDVARQTNRRLAVVIDGCRHGATNRLLIAQYLESIRGSLKPVSLRDPKSVVFNGYDLTNKTYYV